jgi:hypothetical protein
MHVLPSGQNSKMSLKCRLRDISASWTLIVRILIQGSNRPLTKQRKGLLSFWVSQNLKFSDKSAPISYRRDIIVRSLAFSRPPYHVCNVGAWRHGSRDHFYFHKISCIWWPRLADFTMQQ